MSLIYFILMLAFTVNEVFCARDKRVINLYRSKSIHKIIKGDPATVGQVPYFVSIKEPVRWYNSKSALWKNLCGGSIIAESKVLTAAHCFEVYDYHYLKNRHLLRVVAGNIKNYVINSGDEVTEANRQWRMIQRAVMHPLFSFPHHDIALVFVNNFTFNAYINYVVPASVSADYGRRCQAVGFGKIGHGLTDTASHILLVAKIDVMSHWLCTYRWELPMDNFICSDSSLTDVARGDSGGPLVCKGTVDPVERVDRDLLVGIVSGKSQDRTTIYTRVSAYKDWINKDGGSKTLCNLLLCFITCILTLYVWFLFHKLTLILNTNTTIQQR